MKTTKTGKKRKKKKSAGPAAASRPVTAERARRLHRMLRYLAAAARTREEAMAHLGINTVRGFYRELETLAEYGVRVVLTSGGLYRLEEGDPPDEAALRLPFPAPRLTLGQAMKLTRGELTGEHRRWEEIINQLLG